MFPMSAFLSRHDALPPSSFSYIAKELSCHAMETYCQRLTVKEQNSKLKVHCYRAMLEKILAERFPDFRHSVLKTVKNAHLLEFEDYARRATLNHTDIIWESDFFKSDYVLKGLKEWNRVVAFYSLRLAFAPVLETIFLLDRALYLLEKGISSVVAPIFDPAISPRNHVIMAVKPTDLVIQ